MAELYSAQAAKVEEHAAPSSLEEGQATVLNWRLHEAPAGPVFRAGSVSSLERAALNPLGTALQLGWLVLLVWLTGSLLRQVEEPGMDAVSLLKPSSESSSWRPRQLLLRFQRPRQEHLLAGGSAAELAGGACPARGTDEVSSKFREKWNGSVSKG